MIKKIWNWIVTRPADKLLHFIAGAGIDLYSFAVLSRFAPAWLCFVLAAVLAISALVAKEIYDYYHKEEGHSVEIADIFYGAGGILLVDLALLVMVV